MYVCMYIAMHTVGERNKKATRCVHPAEICNRDESRDVRKEVENVVRMPREKMIGMDK